MATVRDIASNIGVSASTVSRSLSGSPQISEEVRMRVLKEARRLGYGRTKARPQAAAAQTLGIAFLNRHAWPHFTGYDSAIWAGIMRGAQDGQSDVTFVDLSQRNEGESYQSFFARRGVHGLILRVDSESHDTALDIVADGLDVVVVADHYDQPEINYVYYQSGEATRQAVEHLIELGHTRIGFCRNSVMDHDHRERFEGYLAALKTAGIDYDEQLHVERPADVSGGAAALTRFLSAANPPTAVFFTDPMMTVGALRRALEFGVRVPEELSIVGVDDGDNSRELTYPTYTAVRQTASELGYEAARWLARRTALGKNAPESLRRVLDAFLEVNQSTGPPPPKPVRVTPSGQRM